VHYTTHERHAPVGQATWRTRARRGLQAAPRLGEYVFDTLTLHKDWLRDPVGVGKEKGPYYSVQKARLEPDLAKLLLDTLDLRWHFSADFTRFVDSLRGAGEPLPHELDTWFRANLINPDYEGGAPPAPDAAPKRGIFGTR
jgi:hypothetical protein